MRHIVTGKSQRTGGGREECRWVAPQTGVLKVNVDASLQTGGTSFAIGMIIRDHTGSFIQARTVRKEGEVSVMEAEARGVLEALLWVQEMNLGMTRVEVECDSQLTVIALLQGIEYNLEVGNVLNDCREILRNKPTVVVSFVKRQANRVAHLLARVPCMVNCSQVFMSPPHLVLESIVRDSSYS